MLYLEISRGFDSFTKHVVNSVPWTDFFYRSTESSVTTLSREIRGYSNENCARDWVSSWSQTARRIKDRATGSSNIRLRSKDTKGLSTKPRTEHVGTHCSSTDTSDIPTLSNLPEEIVSEIMKQLSPLSLWSFRQTSPVYFRIFDSKDFNEYQGELELRDRRRCFDVGKLSIGERAEACEQLRRDDQVEGVVAVSMYCESCLEVNNRGDGDPRLVSLRKPRFCEACGENHAGVFFPAQDVEAYDARGEKLNCLGTTGSWHICHHGDTASVTWDTIARQMARSNEFGVETKQFCKHRAHRLIQPKTQPPSSDCVVSASPRLHLTRGYLGAVELSYGWDLALFDIDAQSIPSLMQVRAAIQTALNGNLLDNLPCCQHVLRQGKLQKFARDGICRCFIKPDNTNYPGTESGPEAFRCHCKRVHVLDCETCSGAFAWQLISGRIFLSYRYYWLIRRPTSPSWMALLDHMSEGIYTKDNKHLLWCDQPGCANVSRTRWLELIKQEACLQYARSRDKKEDQETEKIREDYWTMYFRKTEGQQGCYKMPSP